MIYVYDDVTYVSMYVDRISMNVCMYAGIITKTKKHEQGKNIFFIFIYVCR